MIYKVCICLSLILAVHGCLFPPKTAKAKIYGINNDIGKIKKLLLKEYKQNTDPVRVTNVNNAELLRYFFKYGISTITVQYYFEKQHVPLFSTENLLTSYDSIIIFTWNKFRNYNDPGEIIKFENLVYSFSRRKLGYSRISSEKIKEKQINDSLWFQEYIDDRNFVY